MMISKLLSTISIFFYAVAVPYLELDKTHVFNPEWPSHARLHEVWQLITNSALGLLSLWYIWKNKQIGKANIIAVIVTGGFMLAYLIRSSYGGSMLHTDGTERLIMGINIGVFGFGLVLLMTLASQLLSKK